MQPHERYSMSKCMCCFREDAWGSAHGLETFDQWPECGKERSPEIPRSMWSIWCFLTLYVICRTLMKMDEQICSLETFPSFSVGLRPCLVGDQDRLPRTGSLSPCQNKRFKTRWSQRMLLLNSSCFLVSCSQDGGHAGQMGVGGQSPTLLCTPLDPKSLCHLVARGIIISVRSHQLGAGDALPTWRRHIHWSERWRMAFYHKNKEKEVNNPF